MRASRKTCTLVLTVLMLTSACGVSPSGAATPFPSSSLILPTATSMPPPVPETAAPASTPQPPLATKTPAPTASPSLEPTATPTPLFSLEKSAQEFGGSGTFQIGLGDLDVFVSNFDLPNEVWLNDGHGGFVDSRLRLGSSQDTSSKATLGDLDGDGDLDVFVGSLLGPPEIWFNPTAGAATGLDGLAIEQLSEESYAVKFGGVVQ